MEVWAPRATTVDLVRVAPGGSALGRRLPMEPAGGGRFRIDVPLPADDDYAFSVDGSEPLPDPESECQPQGVFGPSRVVDHGDFEWTDGAWRGVPLAGSAVYELHIGTFSEEGTFDGAIEHLDHLADLGVDIVEVMPVNAFDGDRGWGYDGVLLYAVHEPYGGPAGFKRFVDAAHERGLGVVLDVVYNHFGPTGNNLNRFGPYTTDRHQTPWGDAVNLDGPDSRPVRRFFLDNALGWLRNYHLDGLRLDAVHALVDESEHHLLRDLSEAVDALSTQLRRPLSLIAEYPHTEPLAVTAREAGGHGLAAEWRDEVHHAVHAACSGEQDGYYAEYGSMAAIAAALTGPKDDLPRQRFVVCAQNHDQVGNRAKGDRLAHLVGADLAKIAAALVLTSPFVPLLFMGEEWAASSPFPYFAGPRDPSLDEAVRAGRREEFAAFGWDTAEIPDPLAPATFESARLDWAELDGHEHLEMLDWYRSLLRLRRDRPELCDPRPQSIAVDVDEDRRTMLVWRDATAVAVNLSDETASVEGRGGVLLASRDDVVADGARVVLPPRSVAVVG
ncbi:MAG TPA: malto-oligosyltrehalose trehalohydrolase [Acidimicrobiales bacterium]